MTRFKKFISVALVLSILLSVLTVVATAQATAELPAVTVDDSEAQIVCEITAMRTEFSKNIPYVRRYLHDSKLCKSNSLS